jgi:hypothetical protein
MAAVHVTHWEDLDPETREALDEIYLAEFEALAAPGVPESAIDEYLRYRHERPAAQITTYEQGQVRRLLRRLRDPSAIPDPVDEEDHVDAVERFGANRLHLTNIGTYVAVLFVHVYAGLLAVLLWILLRS